jgi:pyridoxine/pyridoxamine 5'-phosphate oxidase
LAVNRFFIIGKLKMDVDLIYKKAMDQLSSSLSDAEMLNDPLVNDCYLATAGDSGHPSVRIITVHDINDKGLFFIVSKSSGKTIQLNENSQVGLCFYWQALNL